MTKDAAKKPIPVSALAYRPRDYFGRYDLQIELLSTVNGRARRALIKEALETGEADTLPDFVTTPELDSSASASTTESWTSMRAIRLRSPPPGPPLNPSPWAR